jgi:hypothetical protein
MGLHTKNVRKKKPLEICRWNYSMGVFPSMIVAYAVIFPNFLEYIDRLIPSVSPLVKHRRNNFIGDRGICSKFLTTLWKIPTN